MQYFLTYEDEQTYKSQNTALGKLIENVESNNRVTKITKSSIQSQ